MAYARSVPGSTDGYRIWIRNLVDGRDIDLQTPGRHPAWDPAGNRIAFQHRPQADGPLWSIFTLEVDTLGRTAALRKSLPQLMMDMEPSLRVGHQMA